jgi:hypothetical protein
MGRLRVNEKQNLQFNLMQPFDHDLRSHNI